MEIQGSHCSEVSYEVVVREYKAVQNVYVCVCQCKHEAQNALRAI